MMTIGRFAPSPSGFLHPGNLLCALLAWLSCKSKGGRFLLRIEDLDQGRCPPPLALGAMEDLRYLGLLWDEEPLWQSERTTHYADATQHLAEKDLVYPCFCTRAELHAAPNLGDVSPVYDGRCAALSPEEIATRSAVRRPSLRLRVPDERIAFTDGHMGEYSEDLRRECGDFIIRRADGMYAYQLAVVVDDAASGVTEVVRGRDILSSTPRQILLQRLLGLPTPTYFHIPLLTDSRGRRLAKRDGDISLSALSRRFSKEEVLGMLGCAAGLLDEMHPVTTDELLTRFSWDLVPQDTVRLPIDLYA